MVEVLCGYAPAVVLYLDRDSVVDHMDAYMDLVPCRLSVVVDVLDRIGKQIDYASDYELVVSVKERNRSIVGKSENDSPAARLVSNAGISLLHAFADVKDTHLAGM